MSAKTDRIGLRISEEQRELLTAASESEGVTMTEFVLEHATRAAENVLTDRKVFTLDRNRWERFTELLDRPAQDARGLRELMRSPSVLDDDG